MKRILVATDFSPHADRALAHALELAKLFSAELEVFSAAYVPPHALAALAPGVAPVATGMTPGLVEEARSQTRERIETLAATLRTRGIRATSAISADEPSSAICTRALETGADLIAVGTRGHTGLAHVIFGSVAERVAQHARTAVLTAHADSPAPAPYRCVLVPTDFSADSDAAVAWARELVTRTGGKLVLLHAYDLPSLALTGSALAAAHVEKSLADSARQRLAALRESLRGLEVETLISGARPDPSILETADRARADAIVMGTRGRTGLAHVLLGSTTERVIRRAQVPVIAVKTAAPAA
ncbi:MAG TPA: universal stress protein [Myxococcota bacterium]|nr:universal stress protein [Myxococcota bacterium]